MQLSPTSTSTAAPENVYTWFAKAHGDRAVQMPFQADYGAEHTGIFINGDVHGDLEAPHATLRDAVAAAKAVSAGEAPGVLVMKHAGAFHVLGAATIEWDAHPSMQAPKPFVMPGPDEIEDYSFQRDRTDVLALVDGEQVVRLGR